MTIENQILTEKEILTFCRKAKGTYKIYSKRYKAKTFASAIFFIFLFVIYILAVLSVGIMESLPLTAVCLGYIISFVLDRLYQRNIKALEYAGSEFLLTKAGEEHTISVSGCSLDLDGKILFAVDRRCVAFTADKYIAITDRNKHSVIIRCSDENFKDVVNRLSACKTDIYRLGEKGRIRPLAFRQVLNILIPRIIIIAVCGLLIAFNLLFPFKAMSDKASDKYKEYEYNPRENFASQMSAVISDTQNIRHRTGIYFEYISSRYNTRICTTRDRTDNKEYTEVYFFDNGELDYMIGAGYSSFAGEEAVSYLSDSGQVYLFSEGSSIYIKQEESEPVKWRDLFYSAIEYDYSIQRYTKVRGSFEFSNPCSFTLADDGIGVAGYQFKDDRIQINLRSTGKNETVTVYFTNTDSSKIYLAEHPFENLEKLIRNTGSGSAANFDRLYSAVEEIKNSI